MSSATATAEPKSKKSKSEASPEAASPTLSAFDSESIYGAPAGMPPFLLGIQRKLSVGAVDDPLEHEADRVAEQVMRMPEPATQASPTASDTTIRHGHGYPTMSWSAAAVQRKCSCGGSCDQCKAEEERKVQRKPADPQTSPAASSPAAAETTAPSIVHEVLSSPGRPLDRATRSWFEPRLGRDFSKVRVHTGGDAAVSARALNAKAYTVKQDVVFANGEFSPQSGTGRRLLGHELTHVVQQSAAGGDTLRRAPQDTYQPGFDSDEQRRYGIAPLTAAAEMSPVAMVRKGRRAITPTAALKDFLQRFPFLEPLAAAYRPIVEEVLGQDVADYRAAGRLDTPLNRDYIEALEHSAGGTIPEGATRLLELSQIESSASNLARTETIWSGWILSQAPVEVPPSPLAERDGRTYLRGMWETVKQSPVSLVMDAWAEPAIRLYISDGISDWELRNSGRMLGIDDLLQISSIRRSYDQQDRYGPKISSLRNSLREVQSGLSGSRGLFEGQVKTDREAAPGVVGVSRWLGEGGAGFDWLVENYKTWAEAPDGPAKGAAFSALLDGYEKLSRFGGAGEAFSELARAYESQVYGEIWQKKYELSQNPAVTLTQEEETQAHTEGWKRALKDWVNAPDVLPDEAQFSRVDEAATRASQYLEQGDLQTAAVYLAIAVEVEQRIAARIDRYKTRVTTGAESAVETLQHIETGSKIFLAVAGGVEFGLLGGAAIDASFTFATSVASGESVGSAVTQAGKAFLTDLVFGKISSAMSAQLLSRGWSPFFAHALANVAAVPYVKAAEIMYDKALDPDSPLPDLTQLPKEAFESSVFGMLIMAGHQFVGGLHGVPAEAPQEGETKTPAAPEDPVKLREQARRQAQVEKELVKQAEHGSITPAEKSVLETTAAKDGGELSPTEALTEREVAHRSVGEPINEPPFRVRYKAPNGHEYKETPEGDMFERCSVECKIFNSKGELIGKKMVDIAPPQGTAPGRRLPPEQMPILGREYVSSRQANAGASYQLRGDPAQFRASRQSGFHVYEYLDANGDLLYVGKSGGVLEPNANWINRLQASHINTDWIASAVRVRVFYNLTEQEMWALEEVEIPKSVHKDANVKPGEYRRNFPEGDVTANAASALKRQNALFAIYAIPVR